MRRSPRLLWTCQPRARCCLSDSELASEAVAQASDITSVGDASGEPITKVTKLSRCVGAQHVTPTEKAMLLCEAATNGRLMKEYGIVSRKPRALGYVAAALAVLGGRFQSGSLRAFNCKAAAGAFGIINPTVELLDMWVHTRAELATQISARRDALLVALEALRAAEEVGGPAHAAARVAPPGARAPGDGDPDGRALAARGRRRRAEGVQGAPRAVGAESAGEAEQENKAMRDRELVKPKHMCALCRRPRSKLLGSKVMF